MKISEITTAIEQFAPLALQEDFDNSGLQVGNVEQQTTGVLLCTDVSEAIVDEAIATGANLIISHHPLIFHGLKKIAGRSWIERIIERAIKHDIVIYCAHTNLDSARYGVSYRMGAKLGLRNMQVLQPRAGALRKIVTFVPQSHVEQVQEALWQAGAGAVGDYDKCSYNLQGHGTFRPKVGAQPFIGNVGQQEQVSEVRIEVMVHDYRCGAAVRALLDAHPYEEPCFDVIRLENTDAYAGLGVVGEIDPLSAKDLLIRAKQTYNLPVVRYNGDLNTTVTRVALCGGAGAFLLDRAEQVGAQIYLTGDLKYHDFQGREDRLVIADVGHFESEQFTKEIFYEIISEKNPTFAINFAKQERNQINYL